ncbi:MAG: DUF4080 domain-containing protein [Bacteroidia bacterium]
MRTLLTTLNAKYIHLNLAIRLLYELNRERHSGLEWREFTIKEDKGKIADFCQQFEVVAFSCYIWNITQTLEVAREIKQRNPNTKVLLGGPEVSYEWEQVIALPEIDFIITGEGEIPFAAFLDNYPNVKHLPNIIQKVDNEVIGFEKTQMFEVKNYLHVLPYQHDDVKDLYNKVLYVETSRGCPYKCEFCLASLDNKVRYLPNESIKANLLYLMQHGRVIKFLDRTFNMKRDFTLDIFQFILENHRPENVFQFEITADILHPDIIKYIDEHIPVGLFRFEIGIQTVNQKANLAVQRKQNFEKTKAIIRSIEHKIELHLDLIVGLAYDYWEDIKYSFEEVFKLFAPELQLGFLKFLKGTPLRDSYKQHGFVFDPNPPYQIIESNYLSKEQLHQITLLEHALEIYWNKKRAISALKYATEHYSIFDFLEGLGEYFGTIRPFHKYVIEDVYDILYQFCEKNYPEDVVLRELVASDYYLQHKARPKSLFPQELPAKARNQVVETLGLNHHKYRYVILALSFDYEKYMQAGTIESSDYQLIIQYSGTEKAEVVRETIVLS